MPNKKNAFMFFVDDYMKKYEKERGRRYPNGYKGATSDPAISREWAACTPEEKKKYKEMEKRDKLRSEPEKLTNTGETISSVQRREKEKQQFWLKMMKYIEAIVSKDPEHQEFYAIHINYHYKRKINDFEDEYCPAEIAIAEFSIADGVKRTYHELLDPEFAPGYILEAKKRSTEIHQLPVQQGVGEVDLKVVYDKIVEFVKPNMVDGKFPPIYTRFEYQIDCEEETIKSAFKQMIAAHDEAVGAAAANVTTEVLVYSLEWLAGNLIEVDAKHIENAFQTSTFDTSKKIQCEYHQTCGFGKACSLSIVHRWLFIIFQKYAKKKSLKLIAGKHFPLEDVSHAPVARGRPAVNTNTNDNDNGSWEQVRSSKVKPVSSKPAEAPKVAQAWQPSSSERTYLDEQRRRQEAEARPLDITIQGLEIGATPSETSSTNDSGVLNDGEFPALGSKAGSRRPRQKNAPKNWAATVKK